MRTFGALGVVAASAIGHIPAVHKVLKPLFSDAVPLSSIPVEQDLAEVERKVKAFSPPPVVNFMLVFFTGLELVAWTVIFGNHLGDTVNHETAGAASRNNVLLAGGMIVVWVSAFPVMTSADPSSASSST